MKIFIYILLGDLGINKINLKSEILTKQLTLHFQSVYYIKLCYPCMIKKCMYVLQRLALAA